jgi:hypothetical protein
MITSGINGFSDVTGLSAKVGTKFLVFMGIAFLGAQGANAYWTTVWFIEFRKRSYKARARTQLEMGDYKGIKKEVVSDIRLKKVDRDDTESLIKFEPDYMRNRGANSYNEI